MKRIQLSHLQFLSILVVAASIPLSIRINSISLIVCFLVTAYQFVTTKGILRHRRYLILFILYYLFLFLGFLNSQNIDPVFFDLEQKIAFVALPLIFAMTPPLIPRQIHWVLFCFLIATMTVCAYSLHDGVYWGYNSDGLAKNLMVHRPYLGMYCVFCFFICLYFFQLVANSKQKIVIAGIGLLILIYLVILFAKMAILTFFILIFIFVLWKLWWQRKFRTIVGILVLLNAIVICGALFTKSGRDVSQRLISFKEFDWVNYDERLINSLNLRFIKWTCSVQVLIENHNWLVGAGEGDVRQELNNCYEQRLGRDHFFVKGNYNSHNQFFTTWLSLGLLGLLYLLAHYFIMIRFHIITGNWLAFLFTLGVLLASITESVFEVQKGAVFYCFFQSLFIFGPLSKFHSPVIR